MQNELNEVYLNSSHREKIEGFRCVDQDGCNRVQEFLQNEALDLMDRNLVRTRLFFNKNESLVGFYSLFNDTVKMNRQKRESMDVFLPHEVTDIPAVRLHFLGIANKFQSKGYGNYIMGAALDSCIDIALISGCTLIVVESTDVARPFYEKLDFTYVRPEKGYNLMAIGTKRLINLET